MFSLPLLSSGWLLFLYYTVIMLQYPSAINEQDSHSTLKSTRNESKDYLSRACIWEPAKQILTQQTLSKNFFGLGIAGLFIFKDRCLIKVTEQTNLNQL
jgi:hypothetical protein